MSIRKQLVRSSVFAATLALSGAAFARQPAELVRQEREAAAHGVRGDGGYRDSLARFGQRYDQQDRYSRLESGGYRDLLVRF